MRNKAYSYTELIIASVLISVMLVSVTSVILQIRNSFSEIKNIYLMNLQAKDILEVSQNVFEKKGVAYIGELKNKNMTGSGFVQNLNIKPDEQFLYQVIIEEINGEDFFVFTDNIPNKDKNFPELKSYYKNIFNQSELKEDSILLSEDENSLEIIKGSEFITISGNTCSIEIDNISDDIYIQYICSNLEKYKFIINQKTEGDVFFKTITDKENIEDFEIDYNGEGMLYNLFSKKLEFRNNYFIIVSIYNKDFVLIKRLGTII